MAKLFTVEMHGDVRELYEVEAETEQEARERWSDGTLVLSEAYGMWVYSVTDEGEAD